MGLSLALLAASPAGSADSDLRLPREIHTHPDGRTPVQALYAAYLTLVERGWQLDLIGHSQPRGTPEELPVIALRSPRPGAAIWILSGIHGEEPAGPNAVAEAIDDLAALAEDSPVVLIPLCNPHGYARNWRYLNTPTYSEAIEGQSVGDSSHLLPDPKNPGQPRAPAASSPEAAALTRYLVRLARSYPPRLSLDLHEDDLIPEGYVYSQGDDGAQDELAIQAVRVLRESRIPIKLRGTTRFGEPVVDGIVGPVTDSSIDELIGTKEILVDGRPQPGAGGPHGPGVRDTSERHHPRPAQGRPSRPAPTARGSHCFSPMRQPPTPTRKLFPARFRGALTSKIAPVVMSDRG